MDQPDDVTPVVVVHVWGVPRHRVPAALARMALDRQHLARERCTFWRLLGTARAGGFGVADADPLHWALLTCWPGGPVPDGAAKSDADAKSDGAAKSDADARSDADAAAINTAATFESSRTVAGWDRIADERLRLVVRPTSSRGLWAGTEPFGRPDEAIQPGRPVVAVTRARIRRGRGRAFRRAVPPVAGALAGARGLRLAIGIGEAPVGLQGTLSLWRDEKALDDFAYRTRAHAEVVRRTPSERWYAEELFARLTVVEADGRYAGQDVGGTLREPHRT